MALILSYQPTLLSGPEDRTRSGIPELPGSEQPALPDLDMDGRAPASDEPARSFDLEQDLYRHFKATTDSPELPDAQPIPDVRPHKRGRMIGGAVVLVAVIGGGSLLASSATSGHRVARTPHVASSAPTVRASAPPSNAVPATPAPPSTTAATPQARAGVILAAQHQALKSFLIALGPPEQISSETGQRPEVLASASQAADAFAAANAALDSAPWPSGVAPTVAALRDALALQGQDLRDMATVPSSGFVALLQRFTTDGAAVDAQIARFKALVSNG